MKIHKRFVQGKADEFAYTNEDITGWLVGLAVSKLPASALSVGVLLVAKFLNRKSGRCYPSIPKIMAALGRPESTVKDGIRALVGMGLLSIEPRGAGKSNEYRFEIDRALVLATETGGRKSDGSGGRNLDGWGGENPTPEPEKRTCEVKPDAVAARDKAPAAQDLPMVDPSLVPVGTRGVEVPRHVEKERRLA